MAVQVVVHFGLDEVADKLVEVRPFGGHFQRTQLHLRLAFEHGFLHIDGNGAHESVADVGIVKVFVEILLDGACQVFFESTLVCTSLGGVLSVDEGVVLFAVLVGMGEGYLDVLPFQVDNRVERGGGHGVVEQVDQSVARHDAVSVVDDGKARVQVGIIAQHRFYEFRAEAVMLEKGAVRFEEDVGAGRFLGIRGRVALQDAFGKNGLTHFPVAIAAYDETCAQGIDRLDADAVQTDAFLERLAVILAAGVEHAHSLDEFALRDAASVVAHTDTQVVFHADVYLLARVHLELVDAVVDDFFQEHIDAIFRITSVAQLAYVHAGACADVLHVAQVAYVVVVIFYGRLFLFVFFHLNCQFSIIDCQFAFCRLCGVCAGCVRNSPTGVGLLR